MKYSARLAIVLAAGAWFAATPAQAANQLSWVASGGSDGNPCTRAAPCATLSTAVANTNPGGSVNCADAGNYGSVGLTSSIIIDCRGTTATVVSISVLGSINVTLRGLIFENNGGTNAIVIGAHAVVLIEDCSINRYTGASHDAVAVKPTASGTSKLTINNSVIANIGNNAISIDSTLSAAPIQVSISNSVLATSGGSAVITNASASAEIRVMIDGVKISGNGVGVNSNGPLSNVIIGRSTVTENQTGFATSGGGRIFSYGTNQINANNVDNVTVSTLISQN